MYFTLFVTVVLVVLSVLLHLETLLALARFANRNRSWARYSVALSVLGALMAHALEICLFAVGYALLSSSKTHGELLGSFSPESNDFIYYSFVVYTSLGFGDIIPVGPMRFLSAMETLTGLVMIAWTASFLFLQMQNSWGSGVAHSAENESSNKA